MGNDGGYARLLHGGSFSDEACASGLVTTRVTRAATEPPLQFSTAIGTSPRIAKALAAAALHDGDRVFVESLILSFLDHTDPLVRGVAAVSAGHVARIHRSLSVDQIVPKIEGLKMDSRTSGQAEEA
ncbi:MAG TPA: hypothetical protein VJM31_03990, partial [Vicinamibacterales bacterium]|nr:hypothetical protein [Vicinamibacterales bacterium]